MWRPSALLPSLEVPANLGRQNDPILMTQLGSRNSTRPDPTFLPPGGGEGGVGGRAAGHAGPLPTHRVRQERRIQGLFLVNE